ncbi:hypothetical protein BDZ97DRAFT_1761041 [Flammula alnicola]|nr:hypothetical protein BDZ97DRAFT_1761041 [Flammula alnicola]
MPRQNEMRGPGKENTADVLSCDPRKFPRRESQLVDPLAVHVVRGGPIVCRYDSVVVVVFTRVGGVKEEFKGLIEQCDVVRRRRVPVAGADWEWARVVGRTAWNTCSRPFAIMTSKLLCSVYIGVAMMHPELVPSQAAPVYQGTRRYQELVRRQTGRYPHPRSARSLSISSTSPLAVHILDQPAVGDLERPFKTVSMFGPAAGPQTDATITVESEAEKRVGKKFPDGICLYNWLGLWLYGDASEFYLSAGHSIYVLAILPSTLPEFLPSLSVWAGDNVDIEYNDSNLLNRPKTSMESIIFFSSNEEDRRGGHDYIHCSYSESQPISSDLSDAPKLLRSVYIGVTMVGVMHIYFKFTQWAPRTCTTPSRSLSTSSANTPLAI